MRRLRCFACYGLLGAAADVEVAHRRQQHALHAQVSIKGPTAQAACVPIMVVTGKVRSTPREKETLWPAGNLAPERRPEDAADH